MIGRSQNITKSSITDCRIATPISESFQDDLYDQPSYGFDLSRSSSPVNTFTRHYLYLDLELSTSDRSVSRKGLESNLSTNGEILVAIRNLFAFLVGGPLVATTRFQDISQIFNNIASLLSKFQFRNMDGSNFGEVADTSFSAYVDEFGLMDVRNDMLDALEMLKLGEAMRSVKLYREAFTHAVGMHEQMQNWGDFETEYAFTHIRLQRARAELEKIINTSEMLKDFCFPSVFAGFALSKTQKVCDKVDFTAWKGSFNRMRAFVHKYYKNFYGKWPPRADSKNNKGQPSGLHRLVLLKMYEDFSSLYDLLADRKKRTTRTANDIAAAHNATDAPHVFALQAILLEYDCAYPRSKPPIPFDLPRVPKDKRDRKKSQAVDQILSDKQRGDLLETSYNHDVQTTDFIRQFKVWAWREGKEKNVDELADHRYGQWIFMYVIMQNLPLLVVEAPGCQYTEGVAYFICQGNRGEVPWCRNQMIRAENGVNLHPDAISNSTEGTYRRSHCWQRADRWSQQDPVLSAKIKDERDQQRRLQQQLQQQEQQQQQQQKQEYQQRMPQSPFVANQIDQPQYCSSYTMPPTPLEPFQHSYFSNSTPGSSRSHSQAPPDLTPSAPYVTRTPTSMRTPSGSVCQSPLPFSPIPGSPLPSGCVSPISIHHPQPTMMLPASAFGLSSQGLVSPVSSTRPSLYGNYPRGSNTPRSMCSTQSKLSLVTPSSSPQLGMNRTVSDWPSGSDSFSLNPSIMSQKQTHKSDPKTTFDSILNPVKKTERERKKGDTKR